MSFGLNELQALLKDWPPIEDFPDTPRESLMDRICQVLRTARDERGRNGWQADLQPLLRHALLRAGKEAGTATRLRVPTGHGWRIGKAGKSMGSKSWRQALPPIC
jgi:hypothetical protein